MTLYNPMRPYCSPRFHLTREELRDMARKAGIKRGRNTLDTLRNLREAGFNI